MNDLNSPGRGFRRRFAAELLEDRSLLSGIETGLSEEPELPSLTDPPSAGAPQSHVQVLEVIPADDEFLESASRSSIVNLPAPVDAALSGTFRGAELVSVESDIEDGSLLYDLRIDWNSEELEVTITPDGRVVEIEQSLRALDLPSELLDWIAANFPGATIAEAHLKSQADTATYEVLISTPSDELFEAEFRAPDDAGLRSFLTPPSTSPLHDAIVAGRDAVHFFAAELPFGLPMKAAATNANDSNASDTIDSAAEAKYELLVAERPTSEQEALARVTYSDESPPLASNISAGLADPRSQEIAAPVFVANHSVSARIEEEQSLMDELATAARAAWMAQVSGLLADLLPLDVAVIEEGLQAFLDEIDRLADPIAPAIVARQLTPRLLVAIAALGCAERLITHLRKISSDPARPNGGSVSTWTWVLDLPSRSDTLE